MINFNYNVPITESLNVGTDFIIRGTAINETVTSNNHKFIAEELKLAAPTLIGVPLLVDHENKVENIKGRVIDGFWNDSNKKVDFSAKVMDSLCQEMIKDGRLNSVSVGAIVKDVEETENGIIPHGIIFKELSLVAVPADSNATFSVALKEAYQSIKSEVVPEEPKPEKPVEPESSTEPVTEQMNYMCDKCGYKTKEMPKDMTCEKCGSKMKKLGESCSEKSDNELKGGHKMGEEKLTETVDSKILLEKMEAMEKSNKEMAEKLAVLSTPKQVLVNEFEESEADCKESYKIIQGNGYFTTIMNKY